ncbi:MAG: thiamine pyrophosphate-binding protein [Candidatus Hermodarchaeota archaeon]
MVKERMTGGEAVAKYMKTQGVPYAVGIPGHGCLGLTDAFLRHEIPVIQVRHEQSAAHLADGYFRATGKPLVVFTSIGPGGCNTVIGVATAFVDSKAMIVITGSVHVRWYGHGVLQEIERSEWADFASIMKPIVKRSFQVTSLDQLPWVLHNAFRHAMSGRPGPVHIDLPMDIQAEAAELELFEDTPYELNPHRALPETERIEQAIDLLTTAKNGVILAGGGVLLSEAMPELQKIAERLAMPVVCTMAGKGSFAEDHPLFGFFTGTKGSPIGNELTRNADVILALGCRFADETTSSYKQGVSFDIPKSKIIQIDIDPGELGKNYFTPVPIHGDVKSTLQLILQNLDARGYSRNHRVAEISVWLKEQRTKWLQSLSAQREGEPMTISLMLHELRKSVPRDAFIVTSAGHTQAALFQEFPILEPGTHITSGGFSTMGFGLPAAMGVKLAHPDRSVVSVEGDGSFLMTCQELATAVQYGIPIVVVLADNQGWISIRDLQIDAYGPERVYATEFLKKTGDLYSPDFVKLAESFGCWTKKADTSSDFRDAVAEALNQDIPAVVVTQVAREHPRSESPVYGWWDVPRPEYLD